MSCGNGSARWSPLAWAGGRSRPCAAPSRRQPWCCPTCVKAACTGVEPSHTSGTTQVQGDCKTELVGQAVMAAWCWRGMGDCAPLHVRDPIIIPRVEIERTHLDEEGGGGHCLRRYGLLALDDLLITSPRMRAKTTHTRSMPSRTWPARKCARHAGHTTRRLARITLEMWTPRLRWMPEHWKQMNCPRLTDAHAF
eukprot:scaffold99301_cov30-Tisochrysis_lutea.AAC.3